MDDSQDLSEMPQSERERRERRVWTFIWIVLAAAAILNLVIEFLR